MGGLAAMGAGALMRVPPIMPAQQAQRPTSPQREWPGDLDELLSNLCRKFEEAEMTCAPARRLAERDRRYYDGIQWTPEQLRILRERGQPAIVDNFVKEKVNYQLGAERRLRSDPKAFPRTPAQEHHADAATQMLRYVSDDNVFNRVRSDVWKNIVVEGVGGAEVVVEDDGTGSGRYEVRIHYIPYDRLWWDPYSADADFHDARHLGTVLWGDRTQFLELFPNARDILETTLGSTHEWGLDIGYEDRPRTPWVDTKRTRVRIVTCHWQFDGDWWTAIYTKGGFLHGPAVSPYVDRRGQTAAPLIMRSGNVDAENNRYGLVRDLISLQDEVNARRSKLMHLLNTRRTTITQGMVEDEDALREEVAKPDGLIVLNPMPNGKFEIDQNTDMSTGQFQLLAHTIGRLQGHGPNAAMTGKDPRELSGRAISLQQAGGAVEQEPDLDGLRLWSRRVYEHAWMRVRQYVDDQRAVRVLDNPDEARWIHINRPVTFGEALMQLPPDQRAIQMQRYMVQPGDPRLDVPVGYENDIGDLDMEITIEEGADVPTLAFEQFSQLMQFAQANPGAIPVEVLIQASSLRNKEQLLEMLKKHQEEQAQVQAQQQQIGMMTAQAKLAETKAKADSAAASATDKRAQAVQRLHGMAQDHAQAAHTPVWPGIGPVEPEASPLLPQNQPPLGQMMGDPAQQQPLGQL